MYTSSKKFPYKNALLLLGSKSLEQLANHEDKLVQIQIPKAIGYIRQCSGVTSQNTRTRIGLTDRDMDLTMLQVQENKTCHVRPIERIGLIDRDMDLQNLISAQ